MGECVYVYASAHRRARARVCVHICLFVCVCVCVCAHARACLCVRACLRIRVRARETGFFFSSLFSDPKTHLVCCATIFHWQFYHRTETGTGVFIATRLTILAINDKAEKHGLAFLFLVGISSAFIYVAVSLKYQ